MKKKMCIPVIQSTIFCGVISLLAVGCSNGQKPSPPANANRGETSSKAMASSSPKPQHAGASADAPAGQKLPDPLRGVAKETMDSGGYTYVLLDTQDGDVWVAAKKFAATSGAEVEVAGLMAMQNFRSATLDRTFPLIQFVGSARVLGAETAGNSDEKLAATGSLPAGHPPIGNVPGEANTAAPVPPKPGEVESLVDGVKVADLFEKKDELKGKTVRFRGRVIKLNRGILGKNWLHIQDGSGAPGTDDITVTSAQDFAPVGSLVVIEGTLSMDKDFGAGYKYGVIVENARIKVDSDAK